MNQLIPLVKRIKVQFYPLNRWKSYLLILAFQFDITELFLKVSLFHLDEESLTHMETYCQSTEALKELASVEKMYAYNFEGKRYDVRNKQGFFEATVETALRGEDLREEFLEYFS